MKTCRICKKEKSLINFHKSLANRDRYQTVCKLCNSELTRRWREKIEVEYGGIGRGCEGSIRKFLVEIIEEQGLNCYYCKKETNMDFHLEHKIPFSRGGDNRKENLAISCPDCNMKKGELTEEEFQV